MVKKEQYKFMWGQKQSAMYAECMLLNFTERNREFTITKGIDDVIREHNKGSSYIYFSEKSIEKGYVNGKTYLNKRKTKQVFNLIRQIIKDFNRFSKRLGRLNYEEISDKKLLKLLERYKYHMLFLQKLFRASDPSATAIIEQKIRQILSKKLNEHGIMSYLSILTTSAKLDKTEREILDWYKLISSSKKINEKKLLEHILKYPAVFMNTWSYKEMIGHLKERWRKENLAKLKKELEKIKRSKKEIRDKHKKIYREFKSEKLCHYCRILQDLATARFDLKNFLGGAETLCLDFLGEIAKKIEIDFAAFMAVYNFKDIFNYFKNKKKLSSKEIKERQEYSILHYKKGKLFYFYGKKAKEYFKKLYSAGLRQKLKGQIANRGMVQGRAKIVLVRDYAQFKKDLKNFKKGEVLVTTMTSPLMVPLAAKAAAIVTNEGGICSHAAVIARELKIPCLVGTHDATNVFENGQLVEVDADKGIVKKLK